MMSPSGTALLLLTLVAPIAAIDVLYFHIWRFRLYQRPESRAETATHVARSLLVGVVVFVLASYEPRGSWFWLVIGAIGLDFVNNLADVALEPASRAGLGGLPPLEYIIHIVGATVSGAVGAAFLVLGWPLASLPSELAVTSELPAWLAWNAKAIAMGSLGLVTLETVLLLRAMAKQRPAVPAVGA